MLHILLLILKIILIILAILIGVILLSLCIVLFVPVHYSVKLNRTEGEGSPPIEVDAKVTWLLHFINIRAVYPSDIYLKVRIMFITLFRLPMKEKKERKEKTKTNSKDKNEDKKTKTNGKDKNKDKVQETNARTDKEKAAGEKSSVAEEKVVGEKISAEKETIIKRAGTENETVTGKENGTVDTADTESGQSAQNTNETGAETESGGKAKQSLKAKISAKINAIKAKLIKIIDIFKNIIYTIKKICVKIKEMLENAEYYLDVIKSDEFKRAFSLCKGELGAIFSYIKPKKLQADLIIGLDDPAATGQVLSYYGILYPLIGNNVNITGDFERKRIEGSVFIKGKIKLFTFLKAVIRIYFNKDIRKLLKLFKKEEA